MAKRLINIGPVMKKLIDTGKTMARIDPAQLAAALGAEKVPDVEVRAASPLALHAVRTEVFRRLESSGGRPALNGTTRRVKIPVSDKEWHELESIAAAVTGDAGTPSAGQIASVLLNLALQSVLSDLSSIAAGAPITAQQIRERLAQTEAKS